MKILLNKIRCKRCGDEIESTTVHDFKTCRCGAVSVDGGPCYLRRLGYPEDFEELSVAERYDLTAYGIDFPIPDEVLREDIDNLLDAVRDGSHLIDCYAVEVQGSINGCFAEGLLTRAQTNALYEDFVWTPLRQLREKHKHG